MEADIKLEQSWLVELAYEFDHDYMQKLKVFLQQEKAAYKEISNKLTVEFRRILEKTEESVKCLLITYFILSILGLLVDIICLIILVAHMSMYEYSAGYFLQMILIGLFLCNFFT